MKTNKKVRHLNVCAYKGAGRLSLARTMFLILIALVLGVQSQAQTSVSRTSKIFAGASPFQDSLWTFNAVDYSIVKRIHPTLSGSTITGINGLATSPITNINYAILKVSGTPGRVLATIDIQTGVCTLVGNLGDNFASIAFNNNGSLFGVTGDGAIVHSTMYKIDLATATKTLFRTLGNGSDGEVIAFCNQNNKFYHWSGNVWERFDTTGVDAIEDLTPSVTGTTPGEVFGALFTGGSNFLVSDINSQFMNWDTSGAIGPVLVTAPDDLRGLVAQSTTSSVSTTSTTICTGSSVVLSVAGGTGNYQWYQNGSVLPGETNSSYTATAAGNYNAAYTDALGITDSVATPITLTSSPSPALTSSTSNSICSGTTFSYTQTGTDVASYAWGRAAQSGIAEGASNATGVFATTISETLTNTTPNQVVVTYNDTLTGAGGCVTYASIVVTVNPAAVLSPTPLVGSICSGGNFTYTPTTSSPAADVTYSWSRAAIAGNSAATSTGTDGVINETLINNTNDPVTITYVDTLKAYGCYNTQTVGVLVNPDPSFTSTLTPTPVCDSALFHYIATSGTSGLDSITWTRDIVVGLNNPMAAGHDSVNEYLDNTLDNAITVPYIFTVFANGSCQHEYTVNVQVNPTPRLHSTLTPPSICDSALFHYAPDTTLGSNVSWTRAAVANITEPASTGNTSVVNEHLHNTSSVIVPVTYVYTSTFGGCSHTDNVVVSVNPKPTFTVAPTTICDSAVFSFTPSIAVAGNSYTWSRAFVPGIGALPNSGTSNPNERLKNNTNIDVKVVYVYTVTANGCSNIINDTVTVHPTPKLVSDLTATICSAAPFFYQPNSLTPAVAFAWTRANVTGLTPATRSGTGAIHDTISNSTSADVITHYIYTLTLGTGTATTCSSTATVTLTVEPAATPALIAVMPPASLCGNTLYQNFGAATAPPAGSNYTWSATNATVLLTGNTQQYAIVNFDQPGTAVVTLTTSLGNGCQGSASYSVNVGSNTAATPYVIYTAGHFVCLDNDVTSFQWGYDDAHTLDSNMIAGEINQSYFLETMDPNKAYWVMTKTNDGCVRKAYYRLPTSINDLNTGADLMSVYPNPATSTVNVAFNMPAAGAISLEVVNMLGQKVNTVNTNDLKTTINIANLPSGYYIINSYTGSIKIGTAKFIKN